MPDLLSELRSRLVQPNPRVPQFEPDAPVPTDSLGGQPIRQSLGSLHDAILRTGEGVGAGIGTVGDILDTPGSVLRGIGAGIGNDIRGDDGGDFHRRALQGILDPSQRVSGREVNENAGLGDSFAGGLATNVLSDPFALGGLAHGAVAAGRGGSRVLQRLLSQAPEASRETPGLLRGSSNLSTYITDASGQNRVIPPTGSTTSSSRFGANGEQLFHDGATRLTDAEQWTGPMRQAGAAMDNSMTPGVRTGPISPLLNLRRDFSVVRDAGIDNALQPTFRTVGGRDIPAFDRARQIREGAENYIQEAMSVPPGVPPYNGGYSVGTRTATIGNGAPSGTLRHETMHGLMDAAYRSGDTSGLGIVPRAALRLQNSSSPFLRGLGEAGEEMAAYGAEGRGLGAQAGNMWQFLNNPTPGYAKAIGKQSPLAAALYSHMVVPRAIRTGAAVGAGGGLTGGAALINQLGGD